MTSPEAAPKDGNGHSHDHESSPYLELSREAWAKLATETEIPLSAEEVERLQGLGDAIDLTEVEEVYLPLSRMLSLYVSAAGQLHRAQEDFLHRRIPARTPFVIGVAGSVAVGKSTVSRVLQQLLGHWPEHPNVALVTTDGFLYPNAELERRGLMQRKGFPESYDRRALLRFVSQVKSGAAEVRAPFYSHLSYDIVPGAEIVVRRPDILIVEGLNVLQPGVEGRLSVADLFDFTIYVDARESDIENWYVDRFLALQRGAFVDPASFFHRFASLSEEEAVATARSIWGAINGPNLAQNVLPTRARADLVLRKGPDHTVSSVLLRKV